MNLKLGINLGFAINKYIEPEVWTKIVAEDLGLKHVQFVADILNPFYPMDYIEKQIARIKYSAGEYGLSIDSMFSSAFCRVNYFLHPDEEGRDIWYNWYKRMLWIGAQLGAKTGGSHFGILTFDSYEQEDKRKFLIETAVKKWQQLSFYAQELGYEALIVEPMSVPREMANTVEETLELMDRVNAHCGIPLRVCLDVGHAPHEAQRDPYPWIERLGALSPVIHLQQTQLHKSHHWPFIPEYNEVGIIKAEKVLSSLEKSGCTESLLILEISHREHRDTDGRIISDLKQSVDYWRPYVSD